ncbi:MAG: DUF4395 domain-containing protein [Thermodesulfobacteriota bacterium]
MMTEACPISFETINEKVARANGALTVLSMLVFLLTPFKAIVLILGADLLIRGFVKPSYSFFSRISRHLLEAANVEPAMTNAGPKIFAAKVGFVFCCIIALLYFANLTAASAVVAAMLMVFALLEAAFGFCVACKMYPYMPEFVK